MAPSADLGPPVTGSATEPGTGVAGTDGGVAPEMVRHEERLLLATRWVAAETVRVRRRIVTETRMVPVEVRVEVLEVEHLPLTSPEAGPGELTASGLPTTAQDFVVVLHEEVPVVTVEVRATERVAVTVSTATSRVAVSEHLRSEQVDVDTAAAPSHS